MNRGGGGGGRRAWDDRREGVGEREAGDALARAREGRPGGDGVARAAGSKKRSAPCPDEEVEKVPWMVRMRWAMLFGGVQGLGECSWALSSSSPLASALRCKGGCIQQGSQMGGRQ
jgi:hypothetical protein